MICKDCGNKDGFLVMVTDYKPLEMWEFSGGALTRYCQKDAGDVEMSIECGACGGSNIDRENFETGMYTERPLVILSDEEWEAKLAEVKKSEESGSEAEAAEETAAEETAEEETTEGSETGSGEPAESTEEATEENKE